jgi:predicted RNA methylase
MRTESRPPSIWRVIERWRRDSLRERGIVGSIGYLAGQLAECVKDSMPERRKSRFGDIDYDCETAMDTTWARLPLSVRVREVFSERLYQPTVESEFEEIMQVLATVDFERFTFIDLGSGKGRAILLAAAYPFAAIAGVEVQPELAVIARANIERLKSQAEPKCRQIVSICGDAREYEFPATPIVLYLFNPFPDYVLRDVLVKLMASFERAPRPIYVIYNAPFEKKEFERHPELSLYYETAQYQIYRAGAK